MKAKYTLLATLASICLAPLTTSGQSAADSIQPTPTPSPAELLARATRGETLTPNEWAIFAFMYPREAGALQEAKLTDRERHQREAAVSAILNPIKDLAGSNADALFGLPRPTAVEPTADSDPARSLSEAQTAKSEEIARFRLASTSAAPALQVNLVPQGNTLTIAWPDDGLERVVEFTSTLNDARWAEFLRTTNRAVTVPITTGTAFFRVRQ